MVTIQKCQCGDPICKRYSISHGTFYQGSGWDKKDAEFVAWCFNNRDKINIEFNTTDNGAPV